MVSVRRASNKPERWAPARTLFDTEVTVVSQAVIDDAMAKLGIAGPNATAKFSEAVQEAGRTYQILGNDIIDRPTKQFYRAKAERLGNAAASLLNLLRKAPPHVHRRLAFECMTTMGRPLRSLGASQPESFEQILEKFIAMCGRKPTKQRTGPQEHVHVRELCADLVGAIEVGIKGKLKRNLNAPGGIFKSSHPRALQLLVQGIDSRISSGQISTALKAQRPRKEVQNKGAVQ